MSGADCLKYLSLDALLYESYSYIAAYVTATLLPILASVLWWAPYAIAGVIAAAIVAVVAWKAYQFAKGKSKST